ncbi:MAG TPA: peptidylprolyl isomerase [Tepidiformaceae bacterium]
MAKRKRREQQHLRQEPARRRSYQSGGAPGEKYKATFPMNLLANVKVFYVLGALIMVGGIIFAALASARNPQPAPIEATPTAIEGSPAASETPAASPTAGHKTFEKAEQVIDAEKFDYTAVIKTSMGDIELKLLAQEAPRTVNNFVFLAQQGYFDGIIFHRVIPNFVIQSGDPTGTGSGGPGYTTEEDQNELKNERGMLSMAKAGATTVFGSQFFINLKDNPALDEDGPSQKRFYPFAQVTSGMDVVDAISEVETSADPRTRDRPLEDVVIESITITETPR